MLNVSAIKRTLSTYFEAIDRRYPSAFCPGYAMGLSIDGEAAMIRCSGLASLEWEAPIDSSTLFHLGSGSKQFTAMLVAQALAEGTVTETADIRSRLDYLTAYPHPISVHGLLTHSAGIPNYLSLNGRVLGAGGAEIPGLHRNDYLTPDRCRAVIRRLAGGQDASRLGRHWYSNTNYFILADLLRDAAGEDLHTLAEARVFGPARMRDTYFEVDRFKVVRKRATSYEPDLDAFGQYRPRFKNCDMVGDSGVLSSLDDLLRWEARAWNMPQEMEDAFRIIGDAPTVSLGNGMRYGYGLMYGSAGGEPYASHAGRMDGFKFILVRFPRHRLSFIYLANCDVPAISSWEFVPQIATLLGSTIGSEA